MARRPLVGVVLPTFRAPALSEAVLDRGAVSLQGTAAGGTIQATGPDVPLDQRWLIEHATTYSSSSTPTTLRLYSGAATLANLLDGSGSGNADFGDWTPGLLVMGGSRLVAVWSGASADAVGVLNLQMTVLTRGA